MEPSRPRRRPRPLLVAALVVLLLAVGLAVATARQFGGPVAVLTPAAATSPERAADGYYQALVARSGSRAFALLCPARQAGGYRRFAGTLSQDLTSGTGIRTWTRTGGAMTRGRLAIVPGRLVLQDGTATPILVVLVRAGASWRVCGSNLGGILPAPPAAGRVSSASYRARGAARSR